MSTDITTDIEKIGEWLLRQGLEYGEAACDVMAGERQGILDTAVAFAREWIGEDAVAAFQARIDELHRREAMSEVERKREDMVQHMQCHVDALMETGLTRDQALQRIAEGKR